MEVNDRVVLNENMDSVHMFPAKYQEAESKGVIAGTEGEVEQLFPSGAGIINFKGHRVLMLNVEKKVKKVG